MQTRILIAFIFLAGISFGQNQRFFDQLDRTEKDKMDIRPAEDQEMEILDFDQQLYSGMLLHELNEKRRSKGRQLFELDSTFLQVANTGVKHFSQSYFRKRRYRNRIVRYTEFGIRHLKGNNRLFRVYTFNFNLTYLKKYMPFYYAAGDNSTALKLFVGKRPASINPGNEDYVKPVPVRAITEQEFTNGIIQSMMRKEGSTEFYSKNYNHIGVSMRLDDYTVNRRKIPRAFVMVIFGGKQTQKSTIKDTPVRESEDKDSPFTVLK